jgi:hypothetical protein
LVYDTSPESYEQPEPVAPVAPEPKPEPEEKEEPAEKEEPQDRSVNVTVNMPETRHEINVSPPQVHVKAPIEVPVTVMAPNQAPIHNHINVPEAKTREREIVRGAGGQLLKIIDREA